MAFTIVALGLFISSLTKQNGKPSRRISDAISLLNLIRGFYSDRKVLSALFAWNGTRLEGDNRIIIQVHEGTAIEWYYSIQPIEGYEFIRLPVNAGAVIEALGCLEGEKTKEADYFRYIPVPDGLMRYGGTVPNVKVRFMVFAYEKADLLSLGKSKTS